MGSVFVEDIINNNPREKWKELIKPYVKKENKDCICTVPDNESDAWCSFTLDMLDPNYQCEYNIGDLLYYGDDEQSLCIIVRLPMLDRRCENIVKSSGNIGWDLCLLGGDIGIVGIDFDDNCLCMSARSDYGDDVFEEYSTMIYFKKAENVELKEYEFLSLIQKIAKECLSNLDDKVLDKVDALYFAIQDYEDKFTYELGVEMDKALYDEFYNYYKSKISNI